MEYDFYEVVKAVVKKVSMVNPGRSNLSKAKVYSNSQDAGFEDIICGWVDVLDLVSDIKSVRKKQVIGYKALGYDDWEIAEIFSISERMVRYDTAWIKKYLKKCFLKSATKTTLNNGRSVNV